MKMLTIIILIAVILSVGCARTNESYGLLNRDKVKRDGVKYCTIIGNVIWGTLLIETLIAPVYFFGFSSVEPCKDQ